MGSTEQSECVDLTGQLCKNKTYCIDIDECERDHGGCNPEMMEPACVNEDSSYRCGDCRYPGFVRDDRTLPAMSRPGTTCSLPVLSDDSDQATTVVPKASLAITVNSSILRNEQFLTLMQKEICTALCISNCTIVVGNIRVIERRLLLSHNGWNASVNLTPDNRTQRKTSAERSTAQVSPNSVAEWNQRRSLSEATRQVLFDISTDTDDTDEAAIEFFTQFVLVDLQSQLMNSSSALMNSPLGQHLDVAGSTLTPCFACPVGKVITDTK
eukprot:SAG31_NODE_439_length_15675_cov_6.578390_8_plen_269_part_00